MVDAKPLFSPTEPESLLVLSGDPLLDAHSYLSVVGALQYFTITRQEISYTVNRICPFMQSPTISHRSVVKSYTSIFERIPPWWIFVRPMSDSSLVAFSNVGWISDLDDSCSQYGFALFYEGNLISWSSCKQKAVARSSTKVEYRALALATTELICVQQLISEQYAPLTTPLIVLCENLPSNNQSIFVLIKGVIWVGWVEIKDIKMGWNRNRVSLDPSKFTLGSNGLKEGCILIRPIWPY